MSYTLGTSTGVLTDSGEIAVADLIGVRVYVTDIPLHVGLRPGNPPDYFGLGHLTPGDANGWDANLVIQHETQLYYPLRDGITTLGYSLPPGVSAILQLLVGELQDEHLEVPWDRNPAPVSASWWNDLTTHGLTTANTYTIPAGRKLYLSTAFTSVQRFEASGGAVGWSTSLISMGGSYIAAAVLRSNVLGAVHRDQMTGPLLGLAGQTVQIASQNGDASGRNVFVARWSGILFDA
jgi:hypothetical protein